MPVTPDDPADRGAGPWLAPWFQHPARSELLTGHHLRPLRPADAGLPGLPAALDLDAASVAGGDADSYHYGVFDDEERTVLGIVRLLRGHREDPPCDVVVRWSVPGRPNLAPVLHEHLPGWLDRAWPFTSRRIEAD